MRLKNKLEPKVAAKMKLKPVLLIATAGIALATIAGIVVFFALNIGNQEKALAGTYATQQDGNWSAGSTWAGGNPPNNWGNHNITLNNNITGTSGGSIKGLTSITGAPGVTFTSSGTLTLQQIGNFTLDGTMTINGNFTQSGAGTLRITSGDFIVDGNLNIRDIDIIVENGSVIVSGNIITNNNATITASSGISGQNYNIPGGGISVSNGNITSNGNVTLTNGAFMNMTGGNGNIDISGGLTVSNNADINFNSTGSINIGGNLNTSGGSTKEININNGSLNVSGDVSMSSGTTLNVADGASLSATNLSTGNNSDAVINANGDVSISQDFNLGGVLDIGPTGTMTVGKDFTMKNAGTTITNVDGLLDVGNDINIKNKDLTGTGKLNWAGDLNLNGYNASINGYKTGIPPAPLDLSTMSTVTLPVELISFTADNTGNSVLISWQTATELNNDYFTIERSANGTDFDAIGTTKGNGTKKTVTSYEYEDTDPLNGWSYYRIKQTDFDGTNETFRAVSVFSDQPSTNKIEVYPNPFYGSTLRMKMEDPEEGTIEIVNQHGTRVFQKVLDGFDREIEMELPSNLQKGMYFVHIKTKSEQKTIKLLKN